jgi:tetratricopeptide (TPR) repeat protein
MSESIAEPYLRRANFAYARGDHSAAIEQLRWALSADPHLATAHALLSLVLGETNRVFAAEHEARQALQCDPELPLGRVALIRAMLAQQRLDEAEAEAVELMRRDPEEPATFRVRARIAEVRGDVRQAVALLESARALAPESMATLHELARVALAAGDLARADAITREMLELQADHGGGQALRGWVLLGRGEVGDAREHALMAIRGGSVRDGLSLLVAVKARQSVWLGLWWRWNASLNVLSPRLRILALLTMFVAVQVLEINLRAVGKADGAKAVGFVWLAFAAYTWVGPIFFRRMLARELAQVRLRRDF